MVSGGFEALAAEFGVELSGGDTSEAPGAEILADVMVDRAANKMRAMRRVGRGWAMGSM